MENAVEKYSKIIEKVRDLKPLVHHITNYVSVRDCANITLAIGASPIMSDAIEEVSDIVSISSSLVLNIGTLNERVIKSALEAGRIANNLGIPVILDPVGAGSSSFRNKTVEQIIKEIRLSVIRGNISEIRYIAGLESNTKGVDASDIDINDTYTDTKRVVRILSQNLNCVVAITGAVDVISDGNREVLIKNGHLMLSNLTGTGCMCSSLIGACCGAEPNSPLDATVTALLSMGISGEIAFEKGGSAGNGSFHTELMNAVSLMNADTITRRINLHEA